MLPYALPLTFGLVGAVAVAVILVEVVPKILEDRERNRRERERTRRGRVAVAVRADVPEGQASGVEREQVVEREQGEWKFKVRQRKGRKVGGGGRSADEDHLLSPIKSHHVLGSDFEATDNDNDENVPLAQLSSRPRSRTPTSGFKTATHLTPTTTGAGTENDTAPLFSPALSESLGSASTSTTFEHLSPEPSPFADTDADAPSTFLPPTETDESRSPTLIGGSSSSPSAEPSPAPHSTSTFSSPLPVPVEEENPFADAAQPHKPTGQILFELHNEDDRHSPSLSEDGWVRSPTLNSDVGSAGSELGDGWTKLSDEEESADEGEAEWAKVRSAGGGAGVGLGLQPTGAAL